MRDSSPVDFRGNAVDYKSHADVLTSCNMSFRKRTSHSFLTAGNSLLYSTAPFSCPLFFPLNSKAALHCDH